MIHLIWCRECFDIAPADHMDDTVCIECAQATKRVWCRRCHQLQPEGAQLFLNLCDSCYQQTRKRARRQVWLISRRLLWHWGWHCGQCGHWKWPWHSACGSCRLWRSKYAR